MSLSAEEIGQLAVQMGLITERELQSVRSEVGGHDVDVDLFTQALIKKELLTNFQVERLKEGRTKGYFHGDYKLLYAIGAGTYARVFRAVNTKTKEVRALKVLRQRYSKTPEAFLREGELGKKLVHPNIIRIFDVASEKGYFYMVMEFIEGQTLFDFLKIRKTLTPAEALPIVGEIVSGLEGALNLGVTHRDMKLTNVMLTSKGHAKIADFGLAALGNEEDDDANPRTCDYAGLEKATAVKKGDPRSDIFFVGCILYEMLCGVPALEPTKDKALRASTVRFQNIVPITERMPQLPPVVAAVVHKAMALDPAKRYQTPQAMYDDIKRILDKLAADPTGKVLDNMILDEAPVAHSLMLVEGDLRRQAKLRDVFKQLNWRALITVDPKRALDMFLQNREKAEIIVFLSKDLPISVIDIFNELPTLDTPFSKVCGLIILDESHASWRQKLNEDNWRIVLQMPQTVKQMILAMNALVESEK